MGSFEYCLIISGVHSDKVIDCMIWAFGENFGSIPYSQLDEEWNKRHADIFILLGSDLISDSFEKIGKAYLNIR